RCPLDNRNVTFTLEGPAEWRGGIAKGEDNCILSTTLPVECGINRALLRSLTESGTVRLRAEAEGLPSAHIEWESAEVEMTDGLTSYEQRHTLPSNFERGETPATPSFLPEKRSLTVKEIIAGSNQPKAFNSIDDNEASEWQNDGWLSNAWITYVFDRPERIDEISLKLAGWRRQSYPIEIVADSVIIWEGRTERSLGYVHLPVPPTVTDRVTIRLKGAATGSDAFGQITELAEKNANALDGSDSNAKEGRLRIVEADFLARQQ
ncbi:MAG: beta-galactosidase, partial [Duncaniella sp.]|nr:beta-galactosidase [Duncaniella sp.]